MLSTDSINFLVQPIIDRQESINTFVLETIANRVGEIGKISPADLRRLKLLKKDWNEIMQEYLFHFI